MEVSGVFSSWAVSYTHLLLHAALPAAIPLDDGRLEGHALEPGHMEEALIEMYLAGVSVRRVEDITEALWELCISDSP